MTRNKMGITNIEIAIIASVNTEDNTCTVRTETSEIFHDDIPLICPALHQETGTGITYYPQVGETVLVCTSSDGYRFILGYIPTIDEKGSYSAGRPSANPGDIFITGGDGNFLILRRGGVLQIGSNQITQTLYIPTRNIIHHIAENFIIDTFAGSLELSDKRKEDNSNGKQEGEFKLNLKEFTNDKDNTVEVYAGPLFSLTLKNNGNQTSKLEFKKTGEISLTTIKTISIKSSENMSLNSDKDISLGAANINIQAKTKSSIQANSIEIKGVDIEINGNTNMKGTTSVNNGKFPALRLTPTVVAWMAKVSATAMSPVPPDLACPTLLL